MSVTTTSGFQVLKISSPRVPIIAVRTSYPSCSSRILSHSIIDGSSSIASTRFFFLVVMSVLSRLPPYPQRRGGCQSYPAPADLRAELYIFLNPRPLADSCHDRLQNLAAMSR